MADNSVSAKRLKGAHGVLCIQTLRTTKGVARVVRPRCVVSAARSCAPGVVALTTGVVDSVVVVFVVVAVVVVVACCVCKL